MVADAAGVSVLTLLPVVAVVTPAVVVAGAMETGSTFTGTLGCSSEAFDVLRCGGPCDRGGASAATPLAAGGVG